MPECPVGRFAPTPSGRLHLGNMLCAMLAYLSVRSRGGRFLLRIEDVDAPRCPRSLAQQCIDDLRWLGFTWDEEPLWQSRRSSVYQHYLDVLTRQGLIYPCFCTRAQLMASHLVSLEILCVFKEHRVILINPLCHRLIVEGPDGRVTLGRLHSRGDLPEEILLLPGGSKLVARFIR